MVNDMDEEKTTPELLREWFEENRTTFASMSHSNSYWAEQGQTYADEFDWFMRNAGNAGKLKMIRHAKLQLQRVNE